MSTVFLTMIVPAALAPLARALAAGLSPAGAGMFVVPLSPTGELPATHYVSSGGIQQEFADAIASGDALYAACQAAVAPVTLEQCNALVAQSDVTDLAVETPWQSFERLGLQMIKASLP